MLTNGKWQAFEEWCQDRHIPPFHCSIVDVLTLLQELLEGLYLAAISAYHIGIDVVTPGAHNLAMFF